MCHYCGHSEAVVDRCSECGGLMKRVGSGTQKVEQELFDLFPKAKVLRMDADTVGASRGHEALLREFEEKNIPILLGTQMVAKGLDFENVTLVGVLDADLSLYAQNYHAAERTYSLLAQVVGRAGRGERPGRAVIQTYHPENEVIQSAAKQDYETFYQNELRMRSLRRYPPFADLFTLTVSGLDELRVIAAARALCDALRYASSQPPLSGLDVEVLGPAGAPVVKVKNGEGPSIEMWKKLAAQDPAFGHPEKFCSDPEHSNWESATITTLDDKIPQYIQKICKRDPFSGHTVTGGIVTVKDSNWLLSWTLNRQQQFRDQPKNQLCVWVYGLFSDKPGNYVKKAMRDCTGKELCMEWLYHIGVPEDQIEELAEHSANTIPVMMPYIDAFFMPRAMGDRPDIVPEGAVNFAFLGQFAETGRDTIFTTEYSMRTGMEAVYTLLDIDRGVPEVWGSTYDVRALIDATVKLRDGKKITDMDLPLIPRLAMKEALKKIEGTDLEKFLKEYNAI